MIVTFARHNCEIPDNLLLPEPQLTAAEAEWLVKAEDRNIEAVPGEHRPALQKAWAYADEQTRLKSIYAAFVCGKTDLLWHGYALKFTDA